MGRRDASNAPVEDLIPEGVRQAALRRALSSERGQRTLRKLERALLAIPDRRLGYEHIVQDGMVCAVGAYVVWDLVERFPWVDRDEEVKRLEECYGPSEKAGEIDLEATAVLANYHGVAWTLAWEIAKANDYLFGPKKTPEQRWRGMLKWVRQRIVRQPGPPEVAIR